MKKTVIVAGGAGFIGSHLCEKLLEYSGVICIDNLYTGSASNINHLKGDFKFINRDVLDSKLISHVKKITDKVDQIYNLACPASPKHYQKSPIDTMMINVIGTKNLLDLALDTGADFLQASTSEVYGNPLEHPQYEEYNGNVNPTSIRSCYDEGKRAAECLVADYQRKFNLKVKIARIFNTYGPRMSIDDGRVVSNFIVQALKGEPITIYGDGSQTRSFCYVDDMVDALIRLMECKDESLLVCNLGNPTEVKIDLLANLIKKYMESDSEIVYCSLPTDDPERRKPDISKARQYLNWKPSTPLIEGLVKTIEYFKGIV